MVRIRFGTFSFNEITKGIKTNMNDKLAHLGGTLGLFNGFSIISCFEFLKFGVALIIHIYNNWKHKGTKSNNLKAEELQLDEKKETNENIEKKVNDMTHMVEDIQNDIDDMKLALKEKVDAHVVENTYEKKKQKQQNKK